MASIFSKIIAGELDCHKIGETEEAFAFLDIRPLHRGHTLVVPKVEVDYLFDLEPSLYRSLWDFSQRIAHAIGKVVPCKKVGVAVIGLEVPHAHIHLIPINAVSDIDFSRPKLEFSEAELAQTAHAIRAELS